jgi:N-acetylglutamate synthase-like GNAT family acetyltransferase
MRSPVPSPRGGPGRTDRPVPAIRPTDDHDSVRRLGVAAGLEDVPLRDERLAGLWAAYDEERMVGAVALERVGRRHVVAWLWVAEGFRNRGLGGRLLETVDAEARRRGLAELWATARAPEFFLRHGYAVVPEGPVRDLLLAACADCPQRGSTCRPEAVVLRLA